MLFLSIAGKKFRENINEVRSVNMKRNSIVKSMVLSVLMSFVAVAISAEHEGAGHKTDEALLEKHGNYDSKGIAIQGYDPVAYHTQKKAVKGKPEYTAQHAGGMYFFATAENRDAFINEPLKYAPEYGGWCATALAYGKKVEIDPESFKVTGGRLFLFYKSLLADARKDWNKDEGNLTKKADENWKKFLEEKK